MTPGRLLILAPLAYLGVFFVYPLGSILGIRLLEGIREDRREEDLEIEAGRRSVGL